MATAENSEQPAGYDRLLNIAASAVTVAAGVIRGRRRRWSG